MFSTFTFAHWEGMEEDVFEALKFLSIYCLKNNAALSVSKRYPYFLEESERILHSCKFKFAQNLPIAFTCIFLFLVKVLVDSLLTGLEHEKQEDMKTLKDKWAVIVTAFFLDEEDKVHVNRSSQTTFESCQDESTQVEGESSQPLDESNQMVCQSSQPMSETNESITVYKLGSQEELPEPEPQTAVPNEVGSPLIVFEMASQENFLN